MSENPALKALFPNPNPSGCSFHSFISLASPISPSSTSVVQRRSMSPSCVDVHRMSLMITTFLSGESSISDREFRLPLIVSRLPPIDSGKWWRQMCQKQVVSLFTAHLTTSFPSAFSGVPIAPKTNSSF
ncbi:hypothetical protein MA16_Dca023684 [Dendrobium catenatum]|uniref:Uncharacterized protein n=1 Tax=Dendrobium catenatum TaxID=906689 RepID=A0A2I0V7B2_9ASPA|nr:hypothetical protein MA16_Dca023684 [Dendrobium catenatum]